MSFQLKFSGDLCHARGKMRLTQMQAAERLSIALRTYQYIESGHKTPTLQNFFKLINLFGLDANDYRHLFDEDA